MCPSSLLPIRTIHHRIRQEFEGTILMGQNDTLRVKKLFHSQATLRCLWQLTDREVVHFHLHVKNSRIVFIILHVFYMEIDGWWLFFIRKFISTFISRSSISSIAMIKFGWELIFRALFCLGRCYFTWGTLFWTSTEPLDGFWSVILLDVGTLG